MTKTELSILNRAVALLRSLTDEPQAVDPEPRRCPVVRFAKRFLANDPIADISCGELWTFYREISASGELPTMPQAAFFRRLPFVLESVFGVRKCHHIVRSGHRVRGFRGVGIRLDASPPAVVELEPDAG